MATATARDLSGHCARIKVAVIAKGELHRVADPGAMRQVNGDTRGVTREPELVAGGVERVVDREVGGVEPHGVGMTFVAAS